MKRALILGLVSIVAMSPAFAAPKYRVTEIVNTGAKLRGDSSVLVAVPKDGSFNGKVYSGSGLETAEATRNVFAHKLSKVQIDSAVPAESDSGITRAAAAGFSH